MKISCHWMADLIALDEPPDRLAADLSMLGLPVDAMERLSHDTLIDIDVTANRPDCLSHLGIARELSALYHEPLRRRAPAALDAGRDAAPAPAITIEDPDLCARFCGVRITGVRVAPSPCWLQERLLAVGQRPINNLVDITNYILLELGHPLHAYDFSKLTGGCLVARRARPGETVQTLDGRIRALAPDMLVIADAARAVGIAGVMGRRARWPTRPPTSCWRAPGFSPRRSAGPPGRWRCAPRRRTASSGARTWRCRRAPCGGPRG